MTCTAATNSAPSSRYSPASAAITAISDSALLMGCRCASRLTAPPTQTAPKARKSMRWKLMKSVPSCPYPVPSQAQSSDQQLDTRYWQLFLPRHCNRRCHQIRNRERQQKLPAKRHQLIVAEARQRPTHPDIKKDKAENLGPKPEQRQQRLQQRRPKQRPMPSAEKQQRRQASHRNHVGVLSHKEHRKLHGAVFGVVSRDELGFGFRQVKRDSIGLCIRSH